MTIKDLLDTTPAHTVILIGYNNDVKKLDRANAIESAAFGPYMIERITATGENTLEADIMVQPVQRNQIKGD